MTHTPWSVLKRVTQLLHDGWHPWVRKSPGGVTETVWARSRRDGRNGALVVEEAGTLTPPEDELVSNIMHNRRLK